MNAVYFYHWLITTIIPHLERGQLSDDVIDFVLKLPRDTHPMTMLSMTVLYLQRNSHFAKAYREGKTHKKIHWEFYYEDAMDLNAKVPRIAALIYRQKYHVRKGEISHSE